MNIIMAVVSDSLARANRVKMLFISCASARCVRRHISYCLMCRRLKYVDAYVTAVCGIQVHSLVICRRTNAKRLRHQHKPCQEHVHKHILHATFEGRKKGSVQSRGSGFALARATVYQQVYHPEYVKDTPA